MGVPVQDGVCNTPLERFSKLDGSTTQEDADKYRTIRLRKGKLWSRRFQRRAFFGTDTAPDCGDIERGKWAPPGESVCDNTLVVYE